MSVTKPLLQRALKNRHIQLMVLGGSIGTGLFLGLAEVVQLAGPAVIIGYAIGGAIAFLIARQLGEMIVHEPVSGSFGHFANKYWGEFPGFLAGWTYWFAWVLGAMVELTAIGIFIQFWWPEIPTWQSALVFFVLVNSANLLSVKYFGELEFWFALIKILAIIGMILFGAYLLISGAAGPEANVANLWRYGGFMPHGWHGLFLAMAIIMFSFAGLELIGVTAAEADQPEKIIPKAINQVAYRILIFYIGALLILFSLYPWTKIGAGGSPFVLIFSHLGSNFAANALNIVVLTAALSVCNSGVYTNSRMLLSLAKQGFAPTAFGQLSSQGIPVRAIALSAGLTFLVVVVNYILPTDALMILMSLIMSMLIISWAMISLSHLKFRAANQRTGAKVSFPVFWFPWTNYLCLAFLGLLLCAMWFNPVSRLATIFIPIWIILIWSFYRFIFERKIST